MNINDAIELGRAYAALGSAISDQLGNLVDMYQARGEDVWGININAVDIIEREYLRVVEQLGMDDAAQELREAIAYWYGPGPRPGRGA